MNLKEIEGYGGYSVSDTGVVIGRRGNPLKPQVQHNGYLAVNLYNKDGMKTCHIHRLVALAFLPNPCNLPQVNHINEDKSDNTTCNLEWCTAQENIEHSQAKTITLISPAGVITTISNIAKFCRENDLSPYGIRCILSGKYSQHKGWRYHNVS